MAWCNVFAPCHFSMGANTLHLKGGDIMLMLLTMLESNKDRLIYFLTLDLLIKL